MEQSEEKRPAWITRVQAGLIDLGCMTLASWAISVNGVPFTYAMAFMWIGYYVIWEFAFGVRTPGHFVMGVKYQRGGGPPPPGRVFLRILVRAIFATFSILSWKRVTLLDLLSGIRCVRSIDTRCKSTVKAKGGQRVERCVR